MLFSGWQQGKDHAVPLHREQKTVRFVMLFSFMGSCSGINQQESHVLEALARASLLRWRSDWCSFI